jgi:hypothetical protein
MQLAKNDYLQVYKTLKVKATGKRLRGWVDEWPGLRYVKPRMQGEKSQAQFGGTVSIAEP